MLAINAASVSTQISGLPFSGPVGGVRVALINGQWVALPHRRAARGRGVRHGRGRPGSEDGDVAIMMVEAEATDNVIVIVEGGAGAPTESVVAEGLEAAKPFIAALCTAQQELADAAAKATAEYPVFPDYQDDVYYSVSSVATDELGQGADHRRQGRARRSAPTSSRPWPCVELAETYEGREKEISAAFRSLTKKLVRERIITDGFRIDGRGLTDIRAAVRRGRTCCPGYTASALFERGETQILGVTTLNMLRMEQHDRHAQPRTVPSGTCTTTTSRRTRPVRPAGSARPSGVRSATARSPSGR